MKIAQEMLTTYQQAEIAVLQGHAVLLGFVARTGRILGRGRPAACAAFDLALTGTRPVDAPGTPSDLHANGIVPVEGA
ncbi:hypothetical protein [Xanthomonas hydrangeae]|uniref:hypothetical protein n=1 Tax=Xanthomonas hydrangeae TaxID=2775159 RepID=UPI00196695B1